jgi:hypothetical protein
VQVLADIKHEEVEEMFAKVRGHRLLLWLLSLLHGRLMPASGG